MGMNMEFIKNDAYSGELDYRAFGSMLDHPTQCYKFYWLEAIMNLMLKKYRFSFDEIFDEMIVSAWYTVTQYHLFLGPMIEGERRDAINRAIDVLIENTSLNEYSAFRCNSVFPVILFRHIQKAVRENLRRK